MSDKGPLVLIHDKHGSQIYIRQSYIDRLEAAGEAARQGIDRSGE